MPSETDALVVPTNGDTEAPPPPRMPRRRKSTISPLVVGILAFIFVAAIVIGIVVVWNAEKRRRQPKQLWLNLPNKLIDEYYHYHCTGMRNDHFVNAAL